MTEMIGIDFPIRRDGALGAEVPHRYRLGAAVDAHRDLEAHRTTGAIVSLP
jgi:NADPH:quinone reductase